MSYSAEQLSAIDTKGQNLLVAAAAGSGKTSVLVERIIRQICDPQKMAYIDKFLVVTFTNAAAAEMRSRIADALNIRLTCGSLDGETLCRHVERQITLLNAAAISTLHSFCQSLLRQYFYLIDLDPNFRVAGETETELLQNDILDEMLEEGFSRNDPGLLLLAGYYGDEDGQTALTGLILKIYEFSRSHPWPGEWLKNLTVPFAVQPDTDFDQTGWTEIIKDKIRLDLDIARMELDTLLQEALKPGGPASYARTLAGDAQSLDELSAACRLNFSQLREAFQQHKFARMAPAGKEIDEEVKKNFQKQRDAVKKRVNSLTETYFARSGAELVGDLRAAAPGVEALTKMALDFAERFQAAKTAKGLVDFSDLEHLALKILRRASSTPADCGPSAVARELSEKYEEIMVDEYQDINRLQEEIIQLLTLPEKPNLFMVGDVKQSIYRFRLAEPGLFMQKYHSFRNSPRTLQENNIPRQMEKRIDLNQNFRSRPNILHGVNFLFGLLMTKRTAEMEYGQEEELKAGPIYSSQDAFRGETLDGPIEVCLIDAGRKSVDGLPCGENEDTLVDDADTDGDSGYDDSELEPDGDTETELSGFEQESLLIAQKIEGLMSRGYSVYDKQTNGYRKLMYRDIVILLRSVKGKAAIVLDTLRQKGVPVYAEIDSGYFKETEVSVMLSLLNIIDNPRQDIHLAAVLRSPLVGLDTRALAEIRLRKMGGDLWDALVCAANETDRNAETIDKINLFLKRHAAWRSLARRKDVGTLIRDIYLETNFYDYAGGMPGGALRQANLRALYERAGQYEKTNFRGLFRFLRFIGKIREKGSDLAVAGALGENEDVVRVMSIHKSKGLEFPVVIVADLGKKFNLQDAKSLVLCHKELGVGPYVTLTEERLRYPSPARWAIAHKIEQEAKAEELRVLYVALTRAKEKLILIGSDRKLAQKCQTWRTLAPVSACPPGGWGQDAALPDSLYEAQILKAKSYLDLLGLALSRHPDGNALLEYGLFFHGGTALTTHEADAVLSGHPSSFAINIYPASAGQFAPQEKANKEFDKTWAAIANGERLTGGGTEWVDAVLSWRYPHRHAVGKPAKLTVSEIKRRLEYTQDGSRPAAEYLQEKSAPAAAPFSRPQFLQEKTKLTKIEYGTAVHALMQHLDFKGELSAAGIAAQTERLVIREILLPSQAEALNYKKIAAFFSGELGMRLIKAAKVWREIPFSLILSAEMFYPELTYPHMGESSDEQVFVQGIIDCLFVEDGQAVLIDYKTDQAVFEEELADKYAAQLGMYAMATETILGIRVKEEYIYSFALSKAIGLKGIG